MIDLQVVPPRLPIANTGRMAVFGRPSGGLSNPYEQPLEDSGFDLEW